MLLENWTVVVSEIAKKVTHFSYYHWINNSWEFFSCVKCVCSFDLPVICINRWLYLELLASYASDKELFCRHLVTGDKMWIWDPLSTLEFMQWKDVDCPTYTEICNSTIINWSDCSHSFSGIQTVCLWQTMCILERQLLISIMQNQHSSYSLSSSRNTDESSLGSVTFSWQCTSAQVIGCSASTAASCPQSRLGSQWLFSYMKSEVPSSWNPVYNKKQQQPVNGRLSGTTRVGRYQKKHSPAHTHPGQRTSFITFLHLQLSMASSLFSLRAWQSSRTTSFQVLFGLPLVLNPQLHTPCISSPNHHHLFAAHAHTNAACYAVIPMLCHLYT